MLAVSAFERVLVGIGKRNAYPVLVCAECGRTQANARRAGIDIRCQAAPEHPDRTFGRELRFHPCGGSPRHFGLAGFVLLTLFS